MAWFTSGSTIIRISTPSANADRVTEASWSEKPGRIRQPQMDSPAS